jgi:hypothetical protein
MYGLKEIKRNDHTRFPYWIDERPTTTIVSVFANSLALKFCCNIQSKKLLIVDWSQQLNRLWFKNIMMNKIA